MVDNQGKEIRSDRALLRRGVINVDPSDILFGLDRLFNRFYRTINEFLEVSRRNQEVRMIPGRSLMSMVDLSDRYEMSVELPGMSKNDINIEVIPCSLEISAEHKEFKHDKDKNWLKQERENTAFCRYLNLPENVKTERVETKRWNAAC